MFVLTSSTIDKALALSSEIELRIVVCILEFIICSSFSSSVLSSKSVFSLSLMGFDDSKTLTSSI